MNAPSIIPAADKQEISAAIPSKEQQTLSYIEPLHYQPDFLSAPGQRHTVKFSSTCQVFEIPSHRSLGEETHKKLWTPRKEISSNARRNKSEFIADGKDWRNCLEEEDFVVLFPEKPPVHPETYRIFQRCYRRKLQQRLKQQASYLPPTKQEAGVISRVLPQGPRLDTTQDLIAATSNKAQEASLDASCSARAMMLHGALNRLYFKKDQSSLLQDGQGFANLSLPGRQRLIDAKARTSLLGKRSIHSMSA